MRWVVVAVAAATTALLLWVLDDPRPWLRLLWHAGGRPYAVALAWALLAPVALLLAALARRPWWWVGVVTLHLAAVVAVTVRFRHLVPASVALAVVVLVLVGASSCAMALSGPAQRSARRASTERPASSRAIGTRNGEHDT